MGVDVCPNCSDYEYALAYDEDGYLQVRSNAYDDLKGIAEKLCRRCRGWALSPTKADPIKKEVESFLADCSAQDIQDLKAAVS